MISFISLHSLASTLPQSGRGEKYILNTRVCNLDGLAVQQSSNRIWGDPGTSGHADTLQTHSYGCCAVGQLASCSHVKPHKSALVTTLIYHVFLCIFLACASQSTISLNLLVKTQKSICIQRVRVVSRHSGEKLMTAAERWVGGRLRLPNLAVCCVLTQILNSE